MRTLTIDLEAIVHNYKTMLARTDAALLPVIKANAYGHGMVPVARALDAAGVDAFGVADVQEALALRDAGIKAPILAWLHDPEDNFVAALAGNVDLGIANLEQLERIVAAATSTGITAKLHLKIDTGLGRNGSSAAAWPALLESVKGAAASELVEVVGIFSHLSGTSEADDLAQIERFDAAVAVADQMGVAYQVRHLTASDGSLAYPQAHYDMVRVGIALYGLDPFSAHRASEYGLKPAMTAKAKVVQTKVVEAGQGVSYGYLHTTKTQSTLALVPIGYAEGLPRNATGSAHVSLNGKTYPISSRVAINDAVADLLAHGRYVNPAIQALVSPFQADRSVFFINFFDFWRSARAGVRRT